MSSNADCQFYEPKRGHWYYDLQCWPYGENPDYDTYGPFLTFEAAHDHLEKNHQNPGGYTKSCFAVCLAGVLDRLDIKACMTGNRATIADDVGVIMSRLYGPSNHGWTFTYDEIEKGLEEAYKRNAGEKP